MKENDIRFIFIGGVARNKYGYYKTTEDIDILVNKDDRDKMSKLPIGVIKELSNKTQRRYNVVFSK